MQIIIRLIEILKGIFLPEIKKQIIKRSPEDRIQELFNQNNYTSQDLDLILFQDNDNFDTFNDWLIIRTHGNLKKVRVTGCAGNFSRQVSKTKWRSRFIPGQFLKFYKVGTFRGEPALKAQGKIDLFNIETGKIQKGGFTHVHGRKSKGVNVGSSSAGCIVCYEGHKINDIVETCKLSGQKDFNLTVFMVDQFKYFNKVEDL